MTATAALPEPAVGLSPVTRRRRRRWARALTVLTAIGSALLVSSALAAAAPGPPAMSGTPGAASGTLSVSVPPTPVPVHPGQDTTVSIRLINAGTDTVSVTLTDREAELGDNGSVRLLDQADPRWAGRVTFPAGPITVPGQGYQSVTVQVHAPQSIDPDLYFVGLLVTPAPTKAGSVQVVNQVGALITLDVPGPRTRELGAVLDAARFQLSGTATGTLQVHNPGHAVVRFFGETDITAAPGGGPPRQDRIDPAILPVGRQRSLPVTAPSSWPVELVTINARLSYPDQTETQTTDVTASAQILLVQPWVPLAAGIIVLIGTTILLLRRSRTRKRARPAAPSSRGRRVMRAQATPIAARNGSISTVPAPRQLPAAGDNS